MGRFLTRPVGSIDLGRIRAPFRLSQVAQRLTGEGLEPSTNGLTYLIRIDVTCSVETMLDSPSESSGSAGGSA